MKNRIIIALLTLFLSSCVNLDKIYEVLESDGMTDIELTGYSFSGCSQDDTIRQNFTATKNNKHVEGVVCGGYFKGYTIKYF